MEAWLDRKVATLSSKQHAARQVQPRARCWAKMGRQKRALDRWAERGRAAAGEFVGYCFVKAVAGDGVNSNKAAPRVKREKQKEDGARKLC